MTQSASCDDERVYPFERTGQPAAGGVQVNQIKVKCKQNSAAILSLNFCRLAALHTHYVITKYFYY